MPLHTAGALRSQCWSTDEVDRNHSLAYWIEAVCGHFLDVRVDTPLREHFRARLETLPFGPATLNIFEAERQHVSRTPAEIARSEREMFVLLQLRRGEAVFRQHGRQALVRAGESVLINGTEPYELECPGATRAIGLRMPADWLRPWVPHAERHPAALFVGDRWGGALNTALGCLDGGGYDALALPVGAVAEQIAALLALALGPAAPGMQSASLFDGLLRTLRDRMHEVDLSPAIVAAEHRVSQRALYYAFATAGSTFMDELLKLRLARARSLLGDHRLADVSVTEIAFQCGFANPSHFARRYRAHYGQTPRAYRADSLATVLPIHP